MLKQIFQMSMSKVTVRPGSIPEIIRLSQQIPEFEAPYEEREYRRRLEDVTHLLLVAEIEGKAVGFKVGYAKQGAFYSWMGGVLPAYRRRGVARALANAQERWARVKGFPAILMKTRNRHRAMLCFALQQGFFILSLEPHSNPEDHRIWLKKLL